MNMKKTTLSEHQAPIATIDNAASLPKNSFILWLKDKYRTHDITFDVKYGEFTNVNDFITLNDINTWKTSEPVFISTQTGSGKSTFIKDILSKSILDYNVTHSNFPKKILILSNRIALNRQLKLAYADLIFKTTGEKDAYEKLEDYYTLKGFDKFYMEFGESITICSYHQLLERKILDNKYFDYIVCDEAHFFIQDSLFNHCTDDILHYIVNQGKNSIRIYMSATLNLAMESILREEYSFIEKENIKHNEYVSTLNSINRFIMSNIKICLNVKIYYIKRNYNFIKDIYTFEDLDSLIDTINSSKSKWLIFVKSSSDGEILEKKINRSKVFISRERVSKDKNIEKTYDSIISNQYYNHEVLITTSILDNGINLLPDENHHPIRNVVLFSLDKTQFLQMLGRVRTVKDKSLNLFLYVYSKDSIKYLLDTSIELLLKRLECDLWSLEEKKENYNLKYHKFVDDPSTFCDYNDCSIIKLIDTVHRLSDIYRFSFRDKDIEDYMTSSNREIESIKNKLLMNLTSKWIYTHLHSGILYRLFKVIREPLDDCIDFENFFYKYILPDYFETQIKNRFNQLLSFLPPLDKNMILNNFYSTFSSYMCGIHLIKNKFKELGLIIDTPIENHYNEIQNYYKEAAAAIHADSSISEQLEWLYCIDYIYEDSNTIEPKTIWEYKSQK